MLTGGSGTSVLFGNGDGDLLTAGSGAGDVLVAGPGAETLSGAGTSGAHRFYGGAGTDMIIAGAGQTMVLAGTGTETLVAGSGLDLFAFTRGNSPTVTIDGFNPALDYLSLPGFAASEAATALAGATTAAGSESISLADGTRVTFHGFTGLAAGNFL